MGAIVIPPQSAPTQEFEVPLWARGLHHIAGIDEVGRGCLAGPVVAAAVILPPHCFIEQVNDSKQLTAKQREAACARIKAVAHAIGVGVVSPDDIDRLNILQAALQAMCIAVAALSVTPQHLLIDGAQRLSIDVPQTTIPKGDARSLSVAAASVVAKVTRDQFMCELHTHYPAYHFAVNKGYGTKTHLAALTQHGPCPIHRFTFAPVRAAADAIAMAQTAQCG